MEADNKKRQDEKLLLSACARGDLKTVERLVDCGVDVNSADKSQMSALHFAVMHARDHVIKSLSALVRAGCRVNATDFNFATPLHIAAQKGNKGCVQTRH